MFVPSFAKRYIAGATIDDAIAAVRALNSDGIPAAIDNLGENVRTIKEASAAVEEYKKLLEAIDGSRVEATISLKLTHLGADLSDGLAQSNAEAIIVKAAEYGNFVRFDMEGSKYTDRTIKTFLDIRSRHPNVGIAIQSYLKRSEMDVLSLIKKHAAIRLVKGAYREPPDIAFEDKSDVDANYSRLMKELLSFGVEHTAIATHDEGLIDEAMRFAKENTIPRDKFEFQMLMGIKRKRQKEIAKDGYKMRVYVPYGPEWLPYTLRRLRERKENIFFLIKNAMD